MYKIIQALTGKKVFNMDEKLAWAFAGGFFLILGLFRFGDAKDAIALAVILIALFIMTIYGQYKKGCSKKINREQNEWEQLGLTKNGKYPVLDTTLSSSHLKIYTIPLGLGLSDFLNKQTQLEAAFHHPISIRVDHINGRSLLAITLN